MGQFEKLFLYIFIFLTIVFFGISLGLMLTYNSNCIRDIQCPPNTQNFQNFSQPTYKVTLDNSDGYYLKTLNGKFIQSCVGCIGGVADCFDSGLHVSDQTNGDKFYFGGNNIQIKINENSNILLLKTIPLNSSSNNIICLTNINSCNTFFTLIPYVSPDQKTIFRILSQNGTYVGVEDHQNELVVKDGFVMNTPNTFFLIET
jgi:hypothetical protein